jgi:hypothetical protein
MILSDLVWEYLTVKNQVNELPGFLPDDGGRFA